MKKYKLAFFLIVFAFKALEATASTIEQYSDEKPKIERILHYAKPDFKYDVYRPLEMAGFIECKSFPHWEGYGCDHHKVYVKMLENNEIEACYIQYKLRDTDKPDIFQENFCINEIVFSHKKWETPRPITFYEEEQGTAYTLSWRYIDYSLHEVNTNSPTADEKFLLTTDIEDALFKKIKEKGLEQTFTRFFYQESLEKNTFFGRGPKADLYIVEDELSVQKREFYTSILKSIL